MRRYALRDDQWEKIKDLLPGRDGHVGVTAKDNRLFVEAVLYRYRVGIPWRDLPERFGDPINVGHPPVPPRRCADYARCEHCAASPRRRRTHAVRRSRRVLAARPWPANWPPPA